MSVYESPEIPEFSLGSHAFSLEMRRADNLLQAAGARCNGATAGVSLPHWLHQR